MHQMRQHVNDVNIGLQCGPWAERRTTTGISAAPDCRWPPTLPGSGGPDAVTLREVARRLGVSPAAIYRHVPDRDALLAEIAGIALRDLAQRMLDRVAQVEDDDPRIRSIERFGAIGRGYLDFAAEEPNMLAMAFLPIRPPGNGVADDPNPWQVLADALDALVAAGAMPLERRAGAETIAWSAIHGFGTLRAGHAFDTSGEPDPDPEVILAAIARSLGVEASR